MAKTLRLSSDDIPVPNRQAFMTEHFAREVFRVDWRGDSENHARSFYCHATFTEAGTARLIDAESLGGFVEKGKTFARDDPGETMFIYRERQKSAWFQDPKGQEFLTGQGSIVTFATDVPFKTATQDGHKFSYQAVLLPFALLDPFNGGDIARAMRRLDASPVNGLLSAFLVELSRHLPALDGEPAADAVRVLAHLTAVAHGLLDGRDTLAQEAFAVARVRSARRFMLNSLHSPKLTPAVVAAYLGISPRQLHRDFHPTGISFARSLQEMRLARAKRLVIEQRRMSITEIAFVCGFDSLATFYRAFKSEYGMTASEMRETTRQDPLG